MPSPVLKLTLNFACASLALLVFPLAAGAQRPALARLEGQVTDSVHGIPVAGATVLISRTQPQPSQLVVATTDERGRYRVDTLVAGDYSVTFTSPFLDSLEMALPERPITLTAGNSTRLDLAVPSGATLRAGACPGVRVQPGHGAVVGQVTNADTDQPLAGAGIVVSWAELTLDRRTMRTRAEERSGGVLSDSLGQYRLCGVPTDTWLLVQVQHAGRVGSAVRLSVPDDAGIVITSFSFSPTSARTIASADSTLADSLTRKLTGNATVSGIVRSSTGQPLPEVTVSVVDAAPSTRTDEQGHFTLAGLPAGTQQLEGRRLGYLVGMARVSLRDRATVTQNLELSRIVALDSVRIVAQRTRFEQYQKRVRQSGTSSAFISAEQIEKQRPFELSDLLRMQGFRIEGSGLDAQVLTSRGDRSFQLGPCVTNVVIDGIEHQSINLVPPGDVGAIEIYRGNGGAPVQYDSTCGLVLIWTKR